MPSTILWQAAKIGVEAGHDDLTRKALLRQRLNRAAGSAVVGGQNAGDVVAVGDKAVLGVLQRVLSGPAVAPLIDNDLDVTLVDVGLKDGHLAVAHKQSVVVFGRAGNQEVVAGGCVLNSELCLKYADGVAVEADIEVQLAVIDHTVVCNDGDLRLMRGLDDGAGSVAVLRDHDERVNALRDEIFTLRILQLFVAVGRLDNQLCAKLVGFLLHILCAAFPLFFLHRCEGYANGDAVLARIGIIVRGAGIGVSFAQPANRVRMVTATSSNAKNFAFIFIPPFS